MAITIVTLAILALAIYIIAGVALVNLKMARDSGFKEHTNKRLFEEQFDVTPAVVGMFRFLYLLFLAWPLLFRSYSRQEQSFS